MGSKNNWDADAMKGTLISDMEKEVRDGISGLSAGEQNAGGDVAMALQQTEPEAAKPAEPTKGVQTYIPMSLYRRLNDIKLTRGDTIASLVAEAVALWVDIQEGKRLLMGKEVNTTI